MNYERLLQAMREEVQKSIRETVNGKIDRLKDDISSLSTKIEDHNRAHEKDMQDIKPVMQFVSGGKLIGEVIKWAGSVAIAYIALKGFAADFIRNIIQMR